MNESALNRLTTFLWNIFCLNLIFVASNIVLIVALLGLVFHPVTLPIYVIALFLFILSFQALLLTLKRSDQHEEEISVFRLYMITYREEFKSSCIIAACYLSIAIILLIGYIGIQFVVINHALFTATYFLLYAILYVHFIFGMLIRINFIIDTKGVLRLGLYCVSKYPVQCLLILGKTLILGLVIPVIPSLLFLGIIPIFAYSLIRMTKSVFEEVKVVLKL